MTKDADIQFKTYSVHLKLKEKYFRELLLSNLEKKRQRMISLAFSKWRSAAQMPAIAAKAEEANAKDMEQLKSKLAVKEREI